MSRPARVRRSFVLVAAATVLVLMSARPASAHVDPDPVAMQAGSSGDVSFGVEHGCSGSPTTQVEMRFPGGFTALEPVAKSGWTTAVAGQVVTFSGGKLDAATKDDFAVRLTAPSTPGLQYIPIVQTCEKGILSWIEIPQEGGAEPDHPAAALKITAGAPTAEDLRVVDDAAASSTGTTSHTGLIVGVAIAAIAVLAALGGVILVVRTRRSTPAT